MSKSNPIVDFLIIGAQKCGTSSLFELLKQHPQISASKIKEPGYFLSKSYLKNPIDTLEKYHSLFDKRKGQLAFEATVDYTSNPHYNGETWSKIKAYNPEMKLIYLVRNPIDRIISAHRYLYKLGVIEKENRNINTYLNSSDYHIQLSCYYFQIMPYIETFGRDQVLILFTDDLERYPLALVNKVTKFLALSTLSSLPHEQKMNSSDQINLFKGRSANLLYRLVFLKKLMPHNVYNKLKSLIKPMLERNMSSSDLVINDQNLAKLREILLPDIQKMEELTGRDLTDWKLRLQ